jgi:hypothetical protein
MGTTLENEDLLKLAGGGKIRRRQRMSRALLARLIGERAEGEDEDYEGEEGEGEESERKIARLLIGSRMLRRRRLRNLLIAHLLRERGEAGEEEDEGGDEYGEEGGGGEHKLARLLIGSRILRRRRVRRMILSHLLRERGEAGEEEDEGEDEYGEEASGGEHKLARLLIGSRILRRGRVRRMLLAHLLRERGEAGEEEDEGEDEYGEDGGGGEHKLARLLIGKRVTRRARARRMLLAHLLRERSEEEA